MTPLADKPDPLLRDSVARLRAKERLYVVFQSLGWGILLIAQLVFSQIGADRKPLPEIAFVLVQVSAIGLLLTHLARRWMERWSWKNLGWRRLVPRVIAMASVLTTVWFSACFVLQHFLLRWPLPPGVNPVLLIALQWFNCVFLIGVWLCLYFFYHLFDRFNRLEVERLRMATTVKHAELRALKSQLNPHFIFNALNSLRGLIDEDPKRAREAVTQLANLLRYSLQSVQRETVTFEEELKVVTDYLSLEQVRHEERLRLKLDVPIDALSWPIPPLLLQTLVENAVKYGISSRPEGGEVSIVARCDRGVMVLRVTNPGQIGRASTKNGSTGVGLSNANDRLRLLFGEKSSLEVREESADLVVAEAIIPLPLSKN